MGKVKFDGEVGSAELGRITAKKNYASSMQSHKMGATYAFDALLHKLAEEKYPDLANEVNGPVAVKQLPTVGFEETLVEGTTDTYNREYIGNFTVGADKGDKGYFGFEDERVKDVGIRLEGTDHLKGVGFNYPYEVNGVKNIRYNADKEALCIVTGNDPSKWTAILEQSAVGDKKSESEIEAFLDQEFKPAYECAYRANPLLAGTTATLAEMNANVEAFGNQRRSDGRQYSYCEIWRDGEYDLYYINQERGKYEKNGVNLYDELNNEDKARVDAASTIEEKNEIFIANRIARFAEEAHNYFCIDDAVFQFTFLYIIVASDNFEKNMYPYKMALLSDGGRWRFFQDDLDSIFSTDNQAQDTKKYSAEVEDFTDDTKSAYVFKGEDSALWQAVKMAFPDRIKRMGRDILQAMYDLSTTGTQTLEKLMGFFDEFFFSRAQGYFPISAYNNDAEIAYEEAWNNKDYVASVDIHPLAQSLGNHNLAERQFLEKRMVYLMSEFGFGGYGSYEDKELGVISFRTQTAQSFTLTPAIDSYPTILGGASQISSASERVKAGTPVTLPAVGGNNTNTYIAGADWLRDIGDLKDLKVDPSMVLALNVSSKRLQIIKVGDEDASAVTSTLESLAVQSCPSLTKVDARNLSTLTGSVNLSRCPRIREALFGGTNVNTVSIAAGSKIEHLQLPDSITVLDLRNTKFLDNFELGDFTHIGFLRLENNKYIDGFASLKEAYGTDGGALQNVRIVGFDYKGDSTDADMLATLADNDNIFGIDSEGNPTTGNPVIEGTLNIAGSIYEDSAEAIRANYPNLTLIVEGGYYIRFADPVVQEICATNWGNGVGITKEQAAAVKNFGNIFQNRSDIETFDEAVYFPLYGTRVNYMMKGCSLKRINVNSWKMEGYNQTFQDCTALEEVICDQWDLSPVTGNHNFNYVFRNCPALRVLDVSNWDVSHITHIDTLISNAPLLTTLDISKWKPLMLQRIYCPFTATGVEILDFSSWESPNLTDIGWNWGSGFFSGMDKLKEVINVENLVTASVTQATGLFYGCSALSSIDMSKCETSNITLCDSAFYGCKSLVSLNVGDGLFPKATSFGSLFNSCTILEKIDGWIDGSSVTTVNHIFAGTGIRKIEFRNLGTSASATSLNFSMNFPKQTWGINSAEVPDARQSLKNTFDYLYDRASAGYAACTITLSTNTLNELIDIFGDDGMLAIINKGYTIANYTPAG